MNRTTCNSRNLNRPRNRWATFEQLEPRRVLSFSFVDSGQSLGGSSLSQAVSLGDLDGDGDLDAFVGSNGPNAVWLNDGSGNFSDSGQALGGGSSNSVALGDIDGDGDLDAWVANGDSYSGEANRVWLNDGSGTFRDSGQALGNSFSLSVALGDLDGDGDLDAWVANRGRPREPNRLWLNDGSGTYIDSGQVFGNSLSVALGDVDGDDDFDAFVGNRWLPNKVWLNWDRQPAAGDANRDWQFDQRDIVQVLQSAKYLTGTPATFEQGDWSGDGVFDQLDIVAALQTGNYLQGPYAVRAVDAALDTDFLQSEDSL